MKKWPIIYTLLGVSAVSLLSWLFLCNFVSAFFPKG